MTLPRPASAGPARQTGGAPTARAVGAPASRPWWMPYAATVLKPWIVVERYTSPGRRRTAG